MIVSPSISFLPLTGATGPDVFQAVVSIVRNRKGMDFTTAFNQTLRHNEELLGGSYDNLGSARGFGKLLNRVECNSGLSAVDSTERSETDIAALTRRFAPQFTWSPVALQWDVLSRASEELDRLGVAGHLMNRSAPDGISSADWRAAERSQEDVIALLDGQFNDGVDRGPILEYASCAQIRGVFRSAVNRLMSDLGFSLREAFDQLKEKEPIFWTLAMLSFNPEKRDDTAQ